MNFTLFVEAFRRAILRYPGSTLCIASLLLVMPQFVTAQEVPGGCGPLRVEGNFGPIDYRPEKFVPDGTFHSYQQLLKTVEDWHFTPQVETLLRGKSSSTAGGDLAYTLRAFPNHHRALMALMKLGEKEKTSQPSGMAYPIDCWFRRAIAWRADDNIVRMIYATYLTKIAQTEQAGQQLEIVASLRADNPFTMHNIGLIYFDMKAYDKALAYAHKAYRLGLNTPTLKEQLMRVGKWTEAPPTEPPVSDQKPQ